MAIPYSKQDQLGYEAGSEAAKTLLKRSTFSKRQTNPQNKYSARKCRGARNSIYDSGIEAEYSHILEYQKKAKEIHDWTSQFCLHLIVEGKEICQYKIDFKVMHNDGRIELIEVKGFETKDWKLKWDLTKSLIPIGAIPGVPKDSRLTLVKKGNKGFIHSPQLLNYT